MTVSANIQKLREISPHLIDPDVAVKIFEELPDALVVVDQGGIIQLVNRQAEILFRYPRNEMFDQPIEMLMPEAVRERHMRNREVYIFSPSTRPMGLRQELKARNKDGHEFQVEINLSPIVTSFGLLISAVVRTPRGA